MAYKWGVIGPSTICTPLLLYGINNKPNVEPPEFYWYIDFQTKADIKLVHQVVESLGPVHRGVRTSFSFLQAGNHGNIFQPIISNHIHNQISFFRSNLVGR